MGRNFSTGGGWQKGIRDDGVDFQELNKLFFYFFALYNFKVMKTKLPLLLLLNCIFFTSFSQITVNLRPNVNQGKDALINSQTPTTNEGNSQDFACWTWTSNGPTIARSLMQFDLTAIPANAIIQSATLNLYCNTTSAITQLHYGSNNSFLKRITNSWQESTVTWITQPSTTSIDQVTLSESVSSNQNYLNIDLKNMVSTWVADSNENFGLMLQLQTESIYRSLILASSDHGDSTKRPLLTVTYTMPTTGPSDCITIVPNAATGKDAMIELRNSTVNSNFGNNVDFATWSWTLTGEPTITRSLIEFQLPTLPQGATMTSAKLSLKCNTTSSIPQLHSGANSSILKRITGTWNESTVTWNNQPSATNNNQVFLNASTSNNQDYNDIEIIGLVNDAKAANQTAIGLSLSLVDENDYRSLIFASSDHVDAAKRPSLKICFTLPNNHSEQAFSRNISVFPNPVFDGKLNVKMENAQGNTMEYFLYSIAGNKCKEGSLENSNSILVGDLSNGVYQLVVINSSGSRTVLPIVISNQ